MIALAIEQNGGQRTERFVGKYVRTLFANRDRRAESDGKSLYLEADPVHLNTAGNELTARRLFQTVTNSLLK